MSPLLLHLIALAFIALGASAGVLLAFHVLGKERADDPVDHSYLDALADVCDGKGHLA